MHQVLSRIGRLNEIGIALSAASDVNILCDKILAGAMELTNSDGGSLYQMSEDKCSLEFIIVSTHSLDIYMGGGSGHEINFPPIPLMVNGKANKSNVVSSAVHDETTINIPDVYHAVGFDFSGTREFDRQTGYHTQSILTIPLKNHHKDIIGVLQLVNAKDETGKKTREFTIADQQLAESLASQAAVAITNNKLIEQQRELFQAFIKLIAGAIDEKSPYTGGHCKRVPELTMMIAEACHNADCGALKDFKMTDKDRYELSIAGWLHDCGKVATPEYVVDKATKLETIYDRINTVDTRFEVLKRDATIESLKQKLERLTKAASACTLIDSALIDCSDVDRALQQKIAQINADRDFIRSSNIGGEHMDESLQQRVSDIAEQLWLGPDGVKTKIISDNEIENLCVATGTLTQDEREVINNHMAVTIKMLAQLPFPEHLANVPEYAGGHHEHMDGTGYPNGLTREQMSLQARMMGIADIFEALSASDRPYKTGKSLTECLSLLGTMKIDKHIDPDIFDVFVRDKVYLRYAKAFLAKSQIDEVNHADIPGYDN